MESALAAAAAIVPLSLILAVVAAAETALERASDVRIQALAVHGDPRARRIASRVEQPREFLGPLTLARVLSASSIVVLFALLGYWGLDNEAGLVGIGIAGGLYVALIQVSVGLIASRQPEFAALQLSQVVTTVGKVFALPAWLLSLPARLIARSIRGVKRDIGHDLLALIENEEAQGGVEEDERRMIRGIIGLEDKTAREVMVPRIDIGAAEINDSIEDVAALINERGYSRVPVYRDNIDDIVGIVYAKDLLRAVSSGAKDKPLSELLREPYFIPESKRLDELLAELRAKRVHMAIVVDEYGGTAGLVTIEDLLEEIVGEIEDEYDVARPTMEVISPDEVVLDAGVGTDILRDLFGYEVDSEDFDTVGGFLIHQLGRLPSVGDEVRIDGLNMRVLSMSGRRVRRLRIERVEHPNEAESALTR